MFMYKGELFLIITQILFPLKKYFTKFLDIHTKIFLMEAADIHTT